MQTPVIDRLMRLWLRIAWFSLALSLLFACGSDSAATNTSATSDATVAEGSVHVLLQNDRYVVTSPAQMCTFVLVAHGTVQPYGQGRWNTSTGQRPTSLTQDKLIRAGYKIVTPFKVALMGIDRDRRSRAASDYVVVGGTAGQDSWADYSYPHPAPGQQYLLVFVPAFVAGVGNTEGTLELFEAFPIDRSHMVTLQPQVIEQGNVSQHEVKMSLSDIQNALAKC